MRDVNMTFLLTVLIARRGET